MPNALAYALALTQHPPLPPPAVRWTQAQEAARAAAAAAAANLAKALQDVADAKKQLALKVRAPNMLLALLLPQRGNDEARESLWC